MADGCVVSSAQRLEQMWPVGDRSSLVALSGHMMKAPVPSSLAPPSANQGWICRLQGARENITVCDVAPALASTHRVL